MTNESQTHLPLPPSNSSIHLPPQVVRNLSCTFDYLPEGTRLYISDAYDVISRNEWWGPFRAALLERDVDSNTGFMFNTDPLYTRIMNAIGSTEVGSRHSGCSIGFVMREMKTIALHGEPTYRTSFLGRAQHSGQAEHDSTTFIP
jgi:hypothetical protein